MWVFSFSFWFMFDHLCIDHYHVSSTIFFSFLNAYFLLLTMHVYNLATSARHNDSLASYCTWSRFLISYCTWSRFIVSFMHNDYCTSVTSQFETNDSSFILDLLSYGWLSFCSHESSLHKVFTLYMIFVDCLLLFFLWVVFSCVLICFVLLMDRFPCFILIYMFFLSIFLSHNGGICWHFFIRF